MIIYQSSAGLFWSGAYSHSKSDQTYKFEEKNKTKQIKKKTTTRSVVNESYYFQSLESGKK